MAPCSCFAGLLLGRFPRFPRRVMEAPPPAKRRRRIDEEEPPEEVPNAVFVGQRMDAKEPSDSDHNAILFTFAGAGSAPSMRVLSWNILCQFGYNPIYKFPFDGFNRRVEANEAYLQRLERIAAETERIVRVFDVDVVLLQECAQPREFGDGVMDQMIQERLVPLGFTVLRHIEFISAVRGAARTVELPTVPRQEGKIHAVYAERLKSVFLNVHLQWDHKDGRTKEETCAVLQTVCGRVRARCPGSPIFLVGDTNRVPLKAPRTDPGAATIEHLAAHLGEIVYPPGPTNVRWSGEEKGSEMTYADFAITIPAS